MNGFTGLVAGAFGLALLCGAASAQSQPLESAPLIDPPSRLSLPPLETPTPPPPIPTTIDVTVTAFFAGAPKAVHSGLVWRVYEANPGSNTSVMVAKSSDPTPVFHLSPGKYTIHAAYGFAGVSKTITVQTTPIIERFTIAAGALKLRGSVADTPIDPAVLNFSIFVPLTDNSEGRLIMENAAAGDIVRLPEGVYHVVSTYGDANAIMRTDLKVESGKITEAVINHRAAVVTLKLVSAPGGEAFAGTAFSVLTPGGDIVREAIGAFPSMTLAEGEYTLIARHEGEIFSREFSVESGLDRDIEILTSQTLSTQPPANQTDPVATP